MMKPPYVWFEESAFCREIEAFRLPRYADLPDFRLYIDQLIALVEKTLAPLMGADGEKWITATMVGNYARQGVIPRSEGKRYGREHAAYLIFVCLPLRPDSSRTHARETHLVRSAGFAVAHKIYLSQYLRYLRAQESETQPSGG